MMLFQPTNKFSTARYKAGTFNDRGYKDFEIAQDYEVASYIAGSGPRLRKGKTPDFQLFVHDDIGINRFPLMCKSGEWPIIDVRVRIGLLT